MKALLTCQRIYKCLLALSLLVALEPEAHAVCGRFNLPVAPYLPQSCSVPNGHGEMSVWGIRNLYLVELILYFYRLPPPVWQTCSAISCNAGFSIDRDHDACVANSRACTIANGTGSQPLVRGNSYGACTASSCNSGFSLYQNACYASSKACTIANGTGAQKFANGSYGACTASGCNSGFSLYQNACFQSSQACTVTNGTGAQAFANGVYGACTAASCNTGFTLNTSANSCVPAKRSCPITNGTGFQTFANGSYGACTASGCSSGFALYNGACYALAKACTVSNGTGEQNFSNGTYLACHAVSCNTNFKLYSGVCYANTKTCSVPFGSGTQTFSNGSYGSCVVSSCDANHTLFNNACVANTRSCTVDNGSGSQTFSNGSYGDCQATSCAPSYTLFGGTCNASSKSCSVPHGSGSQLFANGSYGACTASACDDGYFAQNGSCVQDNPPVVTNLNWPNQLQITLPSKITGQVQSSASTMNLVLGVSGADKIECTYSAPAGNPDYAFTSCSATAFSCSWKDCGSADTFAAGDTVNANYLNMTVPACTGVGCALAQADQVIGNEFGMCYSTVTSALHLLGDLNCDPAHDPAIQFVGDNLVLNGRGHAIHESGTKYSVYVQGNGATVKNLNVSNNPDGTGLFVYDSDAILVNNSNFQGNDVGVDIYVDSAAVSHASFTNNMAPNNNAIGLKISGDGGSFVNNPVITNNDLSNSGLYAMHLNLANGTFNGLGGNKLKGSKFGFGFTGGSLSLSNIDISKCGILRSAVSATDAQSVSVSSSNLTVPDSAGAGDQNHIALDLYRVANVSVSSVTISDSDVGIKVATDSGVHTVFTVGTSVIQHAALAGILIQSYDGTTYGNVQITGNDLRFNPDGRAIWNTGSVLGAGSNVSGNQQ